MARFRLEPGPIPLHHQVYVDLLAALDTGEWGVGDRLPTERELAERYGCSLITVRRALGDLAREERIERTRGRGTVVVQPPIVRELTSTLSFAQEMQLQGLEPGTALIGARIGPADDRTAAALQIGVGAPVHRLERLRSAGGTPLLLEQVALSVARFPDLLAADLERGSLYDFLADRYECRIVRLRETIEPVLPPAREARLLGQSHRQPALLLVGTAFAEDGTPVESSRTFVPGARSRFLIESTGRWARGLRAMRGAAPDNQADEFESLLLAGPAGGHGRAGN